jgi:hypothetical protein
VGLKVSQALHIRLHGSALAADEIVGVGAQAGDGALLGFTARLRIRFEACDHLPQLVDRTAEALTVLLGEFRSLGGDHAATQAQP